MPTTIRANPHVSNAILKGLAAGKTPNTISNAEWANIKKTALQQIKNSGNPKATGDAVKKSLELAKRTTNAPKMKDAIDAFAKKDLAEAVKERQAALKKSPSVNSWGGYNNYRGGRS